MTLFVPAGYYQHTISWTVDGSTHKNSSSYGVKNDGGGDLGAILTALNDIWVMHMTGGALGSGWTMVDGTLENVGVLLTIPINVVGTASSTPPPNTSVLIKKITTARGRHNQGRMYLPAGYVGESQVDDAGLIDPDSLADIQTNVTAVFTDVLAADHVDDVSLFHTDEALEPTPIDFLLAEAMVATQRRRLR